MTTLRTGQWLLLGTPLLLLCSAPWIAASSDVCKTCHPNATCIERDNKYSCMCNFGLIGNGRTQCLDKDECQMGAYKICGEHTACHNTHGSYYCICLKGYRPTNKHENFIPNDGTFCDDIDECDVPDICGNHARCKNIPGSYECYCTEGYKPQSRTEPFQANGDLYVCQDVDECKVPGICGDKGQCTNTPGAYKCDCTEGYKLQKNTKGSKPLCQAIDCGPPPVIPHSKTISTGDTTFGSHVTYMCQSGFLASNGPNTSVCTVTGTWDGANLICNDIDECKVQRICGDKGQCTNTPGAYECDCEKGYQLQKNTKGSKPLCQAIDCGPPPVLPHSEIISSGQTTFGSHVTYMCQSGFLATNGLNTSVCTVNGTWDGANLICNAIDCGQPPTLPNMHIDNMNSTTFGTKVIYSCDDGFLTENSNANTAFCSSNGSWTEAQIKCKAIDCGYPQALPNTVINSLNQTTYGSEVTFMCLKGFIAESGSNTSFCNSKGLWEGSSLKCEVLDCGPPPLIQNAKPDQLWNTTYGSTVTFQCLPGFILESGNDIITCNEEGEWIGAKLVCREQNCGPPPVLPNTDIHWNGSSRVGSEAQYTCQHGFYSPDLWWMSRCTANELWEPTNFTCEEVDCGIPLTIEHADWIWNNKSSMGSSIHYKCKPGFKDNAEKNVSYCLGNSTWEVLNLTCEVKEDLISNLKIFNETCLNWMKSSDFFGWEILYTFRISGVRRIDNQLLDEKMLNYTTDDENPVVCLDLLSDSNYTITLTAKSPEVPSVVLNVTMQTTIKQAFGPIVLVNKSCLTWTRSAHSKEMYSVLIQSKPLFPESLLQNVIFNFTTEERIPVLCLKLPPAAEYMINITELSTKLSSCVNLIQTRMESNNSIHRKTFNETCLQWNRSFHGLQEIYTLHVKGDKWSPDALHQDILFNNKKDQNVTLVCFHPNVNSGFSHLAESSVQNLTVYNETCLMWRRQLRSKELYVISAHGYRWHQKGFKHRFMFNFTTEETYPVVCLELQKRTNYTVEIVLASYRHHPTHINIFSAESDSPAPRLKIVPANSQLPKISFHKSNRSGHISSYQVFVIQHRTECSFACEFLEPVTYFSNLSKTQGYVTGEFFPGDIAEHLDFFVGDRQYYGDFYNAPLERGKDYCIILRTVSKLKTHMCMVVAEIEELSVSRHHLAVVLLGSMGLTFFIVIVSYSTARCCNR